MIRIVRAKLHGIRVTEADLHYHGSITLDPDHCHEAGIVPMEFLDIWNKRSGARIQTYAIYGELGSRCCILNGAAARTCQLGDELIICASEWLPSPTDIKAVRPRVLTFTEQNHVVQIMRYEADQDDSGRFTFAVRDETPNSSETAKPDRRILDLDALKAELRGVDWDDKRIADFLAKHTAIGGAAV